MANWIMALSEDSYRSIVKHELLPFYGDSKSQNLIDSTQIGDNLVFYITKKKSLKGLAKIKSKSFLDESIVFGDNRDIEWNQRLKIKFVDSSKETDFKPLIDNLDLIKRKDIVYSAYFVRTLIKISNKDFGFIKKALGL